MIIGLLFLVLIICFLWKRKIRANRVNEIFSNFEVPGFFAPHESYVSADLQSAISIDKVNRLISLQDEVGSCRYYDGDYIISTDIIINEKVVERRPFINVWGSYLVGKWIGGDNVAQVAALTSKVDINKEITSIKLIIIVNDLDQPNYEIVVLTGQPNKNQQESALKQAEYWNGMLKVLSNDKFE